MRSRSYIRGLDAVRAISDPKRRGYAFEDFVADLFRALDFDVTPNAGAALPRQTDVVARRGAEAYLIEAKWEDREAGSPEIDDLYSRLGRTNDELVGILFAYGGFNAEAVRDVQGRRARPVLLFDREGIEEANADTKAILRLIDLKKTLLVDRAVVHTGESEKTRHHNRGLPSSTAEFIDREGTHTFVHRSGGGYAKLVFAANLPDVDWVPGAGHGVSLDLSLEASTVDDLVGVLKDLLSSRWTRKPKYRSERAARWGLHQAESNWNGEGSKEFISTLKSWRRRYQEPGVGHLHHTEEFVYVDTCRYGFLTLTGETISTVHLVRHATLSFQLTGIPLDGEMVRRLERHFNFDAVFRPLSGRSVYRRNLRTEAAARINPLARIVQNMDGEQWVVGIVIPNFYKKKGARTTIFEEGMTTAEEESGLPWNIEEPEVLICDLAQWHLLDGPKRRYYLRSIEWASTSEATVIRPVADWEHVRHRKSREDKSLPIPADEQRPRSTGSQDVTLVIPGPRQSSRLMS